MGRSIPSPEITAGITHLHHHILGFVLFAAVVAVVGFLCGTRHQRRSAPPPQSPASKPESRKRKLSMSLSTKLPDGFWRREETNKKAGSGKEDKEESLWMKAIILGDKCKVPEEDDEEEGSFVVRDGKGNRQRSYRPRTPRSLPVSRANSFSDKDGDAAAGVSSF